MTAALRFPYEPLRDVARLAIPLTDTPTGEHTYEGRRSYAKVLGASTRVIQRWQRDGLNTFEADQAATILGQHPSAIWPDWFQQRPGEVWAGMSEVADVAYRTPLPPRTPAPLGSCCTCQACGGLLVCERSCLPCAYGVCANNDRPDPCGCGYYSPLSSLPA